ncbi:MAG: DUF2726 domain-containing protein [Candidatus Falkowbacteria bacterium]
MPGLLIILVIIYAVVVLVWIIDRIRENRGPIGRETFWPYRKKEFLLTQTEKRFYHLLEDTLSKGYHVFPKVRLLDMLYLDREMIRKKKLNPEKILARVRQKHVDFLIASRLNVRPLLVIELDGDPGDTRGREFRDEFLNEILSDVKLPLLRVRAAYYYDERKIAADVNELINKARSK